MSISPGHAADADHLGPDATPPRGQPGVRRWPGRLLVISGLLPLLLLLTQPPSPTLLSYSLFVAIYRWRDHLCPQLTRLQAPLPLLLIPLFIAAGLLTEVFAWTDSFLRCEPEPALFHPQLLPDLIHGIGFYGSWGIAWSLLVLRYRFSIAAVFVVQGLYGVAIEQNGAVLLTGLASFPTGLVLWTFVFAIYGATAGTAYSLVACRVGSARQRDHWSKYPIALLTLGVLLVIVGLIWGALLATANILPPARFICDHPFW